ncbi:unnamed protein product [Urochloa decumbens]|uniref:Uncharacterized protein n=1 Tax=Urochloa decumbens TaxID=240449 RepID=A0ABC9GFH8_9POAL
MANNLNAPPALPPWSSPRAVLEAVERLVVEENNNAEEGWTWQQIKDSLMTIHNLNQGELAQNFDTELATVLTGLLHGDHLVTGVNQQRYKLHTAVPHHLPSWFGKGAVLDAVMNLDNVNNNANGSTWAQIRNSLMEANHQQQQLLPPNFGKSMRKMLSVLRKRGHLTGGDMGPQHYTRRHAPALANPNDHIPLEEFQLGYYLGYIMGGNDGFLFGNVDGMMVGMGFHDDEDEAE